MNLKLRTKQFFTFIIVILMIFAMMIPAYADGVSDNKLSELPKVGEKVNGFTTVERGKVNILGADTAFFKHDKSGANLLYIQTEDKNRSFNITFRTPAINETGMPHVFEHISISGSQEYPSQNIFFPVINQTYTTFVNAFTMPTHTSYPLASMSEQQLLVLSDFYMGGVFNPLLLTEERLYKREAWRYELEDKDSPITITGTVYNEMKGNHNISNAAYFNTLKTLFPNSIMSNNSGGDPDFIPNMTYDDLIKFHDKYYHPSNALIVLYGDLDYKSFLKHYDEKFFSKYDIKEVDIETGIIKPLTQPQDKTYLFEVEKGSTAEKSSIIDYAFALNGITTEEYTALDLATAVLNMESSQLKKNMEKLFPGAQTFAAVVNQHNTPFLLFRAQGLNENDKPAFKKVVDDALSDVLKNGFDKELTDAILSTVELNNLLVTENINLGVEISSSIAAEWAIKNDINAMNAEMDAIKKIGGKVDGGYLEKIVKKYLIDNKHSALLATVPSPGLAEQKNAELEKKLADKKAAMTDEQIQALVKETAELKAWSEVEAPAELLEKLKVVTAENLPEEVKEYSVNRNDKNKVTYMSAEASVGNIGRTDILFDSSAIKPEDVQYYSLYTSLLGSLDTKNYSKDELTTETLRYLNGFSTSASIMYDKENQFHPKFRTSFMGLMDDYDKSLDLTFEVLFNTDFTDTEKISKFVSQQMNNLKQDINMNSYNYLMLRACGQENEAIKYNSNISGLEFYEFLKQVEKQLESDPQKVTEKLNSISKQLKNSTNLLVLYAGNKDGIKKFNNSIDSFVNKLDKNEIKRADYSILPTSSGREAIVIDSAVQYNILYSSLEGLGYKYSGKLAPITKYIYDAYLTPKIRHGIGAYDNIISFASNGLIMLSYRDPSIVETNKVYDELDEFMLNTKVTDKELESYIISSYGDYTRSLGELSGAVSFIYNAYNGYTVEDTKQLLREIKSLTSKDLKEFAAVLKEYTENGIRATIGSASMIEKNKELFDNILMPFGDSSSDSDKALTRAELVSLIFGGTEGAFEQARAMGIIKGNGNGNYGENDKVTREEFAVILTRSLQGLSAGSSDGIKDFDSISTWAKEAVATLVSLKLFTLDDNGNVNPHSDVTMSDFMTVINALQTLQ